MQTVFVPDLLKQISVGPPQVLHHVVFLPLLLEEGSASHPGSYLAAPDALVEGQLHIRESGNVPTLLVRNNAMLPVFLPAGMYLKGGGQDRMVVVSMVIPENCAGEIPVRCVEAGRWRPSSQDAYSSPDDGSMAGSTMVGGSLETSQSKVWQTVDTVSQTTQTQSSSRRLGDVYQQTQVQRESFQQAFTLPTDHMAVGACFYVQHAHGSHLAIDIFGQPELLEKFFDGLRDSAALTAVGLRPSDRLPSVAVATLEVRNSLDDLRTMARDQQHIASSRGRLWVGGDVGRRAAILEDLGDALHILYRKD